MEIVVMTNEHLQGTWRDDPYVFPPQQARVWGAKFDNGKLTHISFSIERDALNGLGEPVTVKKAMTNVSVNSSLIDVIKVLCNGEEIMEIG